MRLLKKLFNKIAKSKKSKKECADNKQKNVLVGKPVETGFLRQSFMQDFEISVDEKTNKIKLELDKRYLDWWDQYRR